MSNWISVKDMLPNKGERVLFVTVQHRRVLMGSFHGDSRRGTAYFMAGNMLESGKWWMPLPELPKEEP